MQLLICWFHCVESHGYSNPCPVVTLPDRWGGGPPTQHYRPESFQICEDRAGRETCQMPASAEPWLSGKVHNYVDFTVVVAGTLWQSDCLILNYYLVSEPVNQYHWLWCNAVLALFHCLLHYYTVSLLYATASTGVTATNSAISQPFKWNLYITTRIGTNKMWSLYTGGLYIQVQ